VDIRRIIREEMGDLQWINDSNPYLFNKDEEWILVNDVDPNSVEEGKEIQKYLINLGYTWSGGKTDLADYKIYTIHHFTSSSLRGFMTFYSNHEGEVGLANSDIEKGEYDKLLYWSDIKSNDITLK
tara:strand:+ start:1877 stop:2254 length:378 start_codon:yes stop_codon:yes gene_type:complete